MSAALRDEKEARSKVMQDYDPSPPRCATCLYHRREPTQPYIERTMKTRRGFKTQQVRNRAHPQRNPLVDRCMFGNFIVKPSAVCDEWRTRDGERIISPVVRLLLVREGGDHA